MTTQWAARLIALLVSAAGGTLAWNAGAAGEAPAATGQAAPFQSVDALLDAVETADKGLKTFDADIQYDRRFELAGDQHIRNGKIYYKAAVVNLDELPAGADGRPGVVAGVARKAFAVKFITLVIDGKVTEESQTFVFDGEWFIEKNEATKRFIKRQVARPGQLIDPLRLGEGPFPIPVGQKKEDILARYDAVLAPVLDSVADEPHLTGGFLDGCTQIVLTPKAEFPDDELREIRLWYRAEADGRVLPRLARTVVKQGDVSLVRLVGMRVNGPDFPADIVSVAEPDRSEGWDVQVDQKREE